MCASQSPGQRSNGIHVPDNQKAVNTRGADLAHAFCGVIVCTDVSDRVLVGRQRLAVDGGRPRARLVARICVAEGRERARVQTSDAPVAA